MNIRFVWIPAQVVNNHTNICLIFNFVEKVLFAHPYLKISKWHFFFRAEQSTSNSSVKERFCWLKCSKKLSLFRDNKSLTNISVLTNAVIKMPISLPTKSSRMLTCTEEKRDALQKREGTSGPYKMTFWSLSGTTAELKGQWNEFRVAGKYAKSVERTLLSIHTKCEPLERSLRFIILIF